MNDRAIVTGAQGFLGRFLVDELLRSGFARVVGIGRSQARVAPYEVLFGANVVDDRYAYYSLDVCSPDLSSIVSRTEPGTVFHAASGLKGDATWELISTSVAGTINVLESAARLPAAPRVVLASSGAVYGTPRFLPISENHPCAPLDAYGASKVASESVAHALARAYGLDMISARIFNLVGPGLHERHASARFAAQLAAQAGDTTAEIETGDLSPTRDFLDVRDCAAALRLLASSGSGGAAYNVATGIETSIEHLLELTREAAGIASLVRRVTYENMNDISRHVADTRKLEALGFRPRITLRQSVADSISFYRALRRSNAPSHTNPPSASTESATPDQG